MSKYVDYIIYTDNLNTYNSLSKGNFIGTHRNGHYMVLIRSKAVPVLPVNSILLAQGHCIDDCPFSKLEGASLALYKLAYNTEPVDEIHINEEGEEEVSSYTPPFMFGQFI